VHHGENVDIVASLCVHHAEGKVATIGPPIIVVE
jgi:hypothetical protein